MAAREMPRPFYDNEQTVGRKSVYCWRPSQRWPTTWQQTHGPIGGEEVICQGLIFRSEADAALHATVYLDPAFYPQPYSFASWDEAIAWVNEPLAGVPNP